jgi:hypothetical protein
MSRSVPVLREPPVLGPTKNHSNPGGIQDAKRSGSDQTPDSSKSQSANQRAMNQFGVARYAVNPF